MGKSTIGKDKNRQTEWLRNRQTVFRSFSATFGKKAQKLEPIDLAPLSLPPSSSCRAANWALFGTTSPMATLFMAVGTKERRDARKKPHLSTYSLTSLSLSMLKSQGCHVLTFALDCLLRQERVQDLSGHGGSPEPGLFLNIAETFYWLKSMRSELTRLTARRLLLLLLLVFFKRSSLDTKSPIWSPLFNL